MKDFKNKVVLVTGASSGIGEAIALAFAREGSRLVLTARDRARLDAVAQRCRDAGAEVAVHPAEVTDEVQVQALAEAVHERHPAVDVLINNAGVVMAGLAWEVPVADWRRLHEVNVMGVVQGIRAFVPRMIARRQGGHVVNMASVAGLAAAGGMSTYAATKFAVVGISQSLRAELQPFGIGVSAVCPGYVQTPIEQKVHLVGAMDSQRVRAAIHKDFGRGVKPEDVARRALAGIRGNEAVITVGREAVMASATRRWAPWLLDRFLADTSPTRRGAA